MEKIKLLALLLMLNPGIIGHIIDNKDISIKVGEIDAPVYNVEVSWDAMKFTYEETINYEWDGNNHSYELVDSTYKWNTSTNVININNKSTTSVDIELSYLSEKEKINGTFDISNKTIKANEKLTSKLTLNGQLSQNNIDYIKVGTINLLIS